MDVGLLVSAAVADGLARAAMAGTERRTRRVAKMHAWLPPARHASLTLDACMLIVQQDRVGCCFRVRLQELKKICIKGK